MYYQDIGSTETTAALRFKDTQRRARIQALLRQSESEQATWLSSKRSQLLGLLGHWLVAWGKSLEGYALARTPAQSIDRVGWANGPATGQKY